MKESIEFGRRLKISKRISIEGRLDNNFIEKDSAQQSFNQIRIHPDMLHKDSASSNLMNSILKKQRPPLIQHSEFNLTESSCQSPLRMSEYLIQAKQTKRSHFRKNSEQKFNHFKQSEILPSMRSETKIKINPTQSVIQTLDNFDQKLQAERKKQMYIMQADSLSQQQSIGHANKLMFISQLKGFPKKPNQNQPHHKTNRKNTIQRNSSNILEQNVEPNIKKSIHFNNKLLSSSKQMVSQVLLQSLVSSAPKNQLKNKIRLNSKSVIMEDNAERQESKNIRHTQGIQQQVYENQATSFHEQIQNKYLQEINTIRSFSKNQLANKDLQILELRKIIQENEKQMFNLQKQLQKTLLKANQFQHKITQNIHPKNTKNIPRSNSFSYKNQIEKLQKQKQQTRRILEQKDDLIYSLSKELGVLNQSLNIRSLNIRVQQQQPEGINIRFHDLQQSSEYKQNIKSHIIQLQQLLLIYENTILKYNQKIDTLQQHLYESMKHSLDTQKQLQQKIIQNQQLQYQLKLLINKLSTIHHIQQKSDISISDMQQKIKKSISINQISVQIGYKRNQRQELSNCSTIKI